MTKIINIDAELISRIKDGDESAAHEIYNKYSKAMFNTLIRITGSTEDAQDLLQESFIKAFRKIDTFTGKATFGAWLKRIVVNTGLEFLRKKKIHFDELTESVEAVDENFEESIDPSIVHTCIKKLPSGSRTVLTLYALEGYSHKEISKELNISESTSKTQYLRGKALLKNELERSYYGR